MLLFYQVSDAQINLESKDKLTTTLLSPNSTLQLYSKVFDEQSTDFYIPQCHSQLHNFTLAMQDGGREMDSAVGVVVFGGTPVKLEVENPSTHDSFNIYCTFTQHHQTGNSRREVYVCIIFSI